MYLRPHVGVFSSDRGDLIGAIKGGSGQGVVLTPGVYRRPLMFCKFLGFRDFAIKIQVRSLWPSLVVSSLSLVL